LRDDVGKDRPDAGCCLPRYAPELNPDEQVWSHAKACLAKRFIATKDELLSQVRAIMRSSECELAKGTERNGGAPSNTRNDQRAP
jgi:transposase